MSEKILVRGVNWIGDAVMTMPALRSLRRAFPEAEISLLVRPSVAPLFERDPHIDEVILYGNDFRTFVGRLRLVRSLRRRGFSTALLLQNAFDAALIAFLSGIPERIGYERDGRGLLLTKRLPYDNDDRKTHHIDYYLNLLRGAEIRIDPESFQARSSLERDGKNGRSGKDVSPWIYLSLDERMAARAALSALRRPVLGMNPGAAYGSAKRWLPERFVEVASRFIEDTDGSVVLFGGPDESGISAEISEGLNASCPGMATSHFLNLAGKTSLRELISLISECDLFVTNDSGPMHVAYAVGTPVAAIFGSTDPSLTGPAGEGNVVVRADISCAPCFERSCEENGLKCMEDVTAREVYDAIGEIIPLRRAVFFDRDGTLCKDAGYLNKWEDFEVMDEISSTNTLKEQGFLLIGISNQSGIGRGLVDESFVNEVNEVFIEKYGFDDFYYCSHAPHEHCACRKPEPGMIMAARARYRIDLKESYVVGDKEADMLLAKAVGAGAVLVLTGEAKDSPNADYKAINFRDAVEFILRDRREKGK